MTPSDIIRMPCFYPGKLFCFYPDKLYLCFYPETLQRLTIFEHRIVWNSFLATSRSQTINQRCWGSQQSETLTVILTRVFDIQKQLAAGPLTLISHLAAK